MFIIEHAEYEGAAYLFRQNGNDWIEDRSLVNDLKSISRHAVQGDGTNGAGQRIGSGVYLYVLAIDGVEIDKREMVVLM